MSEGGKERKGRVIGLTGGIACGKSAVSEELKRGGWLLLDTDEIAHAQYLPGSKGHKNVVDAFGSVILNQDQSVNRSILGRIVFSDPEKLRLLNSIIHPLVRAAWQEQLNEHLNRRPDIPAAVVIPLLFEIGAQAQFERVVCVACSISLQIRRLRERGLTPEEAEQRLAAQLPLEQKIKQSHIHIWNNGNRTLLQSQTARLMALCV